MKDAVFVFFLIGRTVIRSQHDRASRDKGTSCTYTTHMTLQMVVPTADTIKDLRSHKDDFSHQKLVVTGRDD